MKVLSMEKSKLLAEQHGWSLVHAQGYIEGETSRRLGKAPARHILVGIDEYALGFRAGYFERQNPTTQVSPSDSPVWRREQMRAG